MSDLVLDHFDRVLGGGRSGQARELGRIGDVALLAYDDAQRGWVHCVTHGLSAAPVTTLQPTELICTVRADQLEAGRFLLESVVRVALTPGSRLVPGSVITNATPLLVRTDIRGVLVTSGLWFDDLDLVEDADERILLHVMTVLPLTGGDVEYIDRNGRGAFEEFVDHPGVDLTDVTRGSVVPAGTS